MKKMSVTLLSAAALSLAAGLFGTSAAMADGKVACGSKEAPCPMQKWMKTTMAGAMSSGDKAKIAAALEVIAKNPPASYAKADQEAWTKLANDGVALAKKDVLDVDAVKANCKACHDKYQESFKKSDKRGDAWPK